MEMEEGSLIRGDAYCGVWNWYFSSFSVTLGFPARGITATPRIKSRIDSELPSGPIFNSYYSCFHVTRRSRTLPANHVSKLP